MRRWAARALALALAVALAQGAKGEEADEGEEGELLVRTRSGLLKGVRWPLDAERERGGGFRAFLGVPYAEPPLADLRFRPPREKAPWNGTRQADEQAPPCLQVSHVDLAVSGAEDCLYLNVYTHFGARANPVLVYMHGGSYLEGHGGRRFVEPETLMHHPLVLVSFNYRLGMFGFLSTEDDAIPGNYGLKDALQVLRWVRANAAAFGGDAGRVVLAGASAGAAGAHLLACGGGAGASALLHGALLSSGNALSRWATAPPGTRSAQRVGALVGCKQKRSAQLAACLREAPAEALLATYLPLRPATVPPIFAPVVERQSGAAARRDPPLVTQPALSLVRAGCRLPLLMGVTTDESQEWGRNLRAAMRQRAFGVPLLDEEIAKISVVPLRAAQVRWVRRYYLGDDPSDPSSFSDDDATAMYSDAFFNYAAVYSALQQAQAHRRSPAAAAPVYFYVFALRGRVSESTRQGGALGGVIHGDDLLYVLGRQYPHPAHWPNATERAAADLLASAWASFAADARPTPPPDALRRPNATWKAVGTALGHFRYLRIDARPALELRAPFYARMKFWDGLWRHAAPHAQSASCQTSGDLALAIGLTALILSRVHVC